MEGGVLVEEEEEMVLNKQEELDAIAKKQKRAEDKKRANDSKRTKDRKRAEERK